MLFFALQVLLFAMMVDQSQGCCGLFPTGRSLGERDVSFLIFKDFVNSVYFIFYIQTYFFSLVTWNRYIGHLEYALKMKKLALRRDMMEAILQKLLEFSWPQCTQAALILPFLKVLHFQVSKV